MAVEEKLSLVTDKYNFTFENPLKIDVEKNGFEVVLRIKELNICTDSIINLATAFQNMFLEIEKKDNYTEKDLLLRKLFNKLDVSYDKIREVMLFS